MKYEEDAHNRYVVLTINGYVSRSEFNGIVEKLAERIDAWGTVGVLELFESFGGFAPSAIWDDLTFTLRHLQDIHRVALVTEKRWMEGLASIAKATMPDRVRVYAPEAVDEARSWLSNPRTDSVESVTSTQVLV